MDHLYNSNNKNNNKYNDSSNKNDINKEYDDGDENSNKEAGDDADIDMGNSSKKSAAMTTIVTKTKW